MIEGFEVGSRFSDEGSELSEELVHGITSLALVQNMGCPATFECCQTGNRVNVFAVENIDPVDAENVFGVGGCW